MQWHSQEMDNSYKCGNSLASNQQGSEPVPSDIIAELQNNSYEADTADNSQLTSVFIEYDDPISHSTNTPVAGQVEHGDMSGYILLSNLCLL